MIKFVISMILFFLALMVLLDSSVNREGMLVPPNTAISKKKVTLKRYDDFSNETNYCSFLITLVSLLICILNTVYYHTYYYDT